MDKNILRFGIPFLFQCHSCSQHHSETLQHLFSFLAQQVWSHFGSILNLQTQYNSMSNLAYIWLHKASFRNQLTFLIILIFCCSCWEIWLHRNKRLHDGLPLDPFIVIRNISQWASLCTKPKPICLSDLQTW